MPSVDLCLLTLAASLAVTAGGFSDPVTAGGFSDPVTAGGFSDPVTAGGFSDSWRAFSFGAKSICVCSTRDGR